VTRWIDAHRFRYWLLTAVVVLAVILPVWASGHRPMWPVAASTVVVVGVGAVLVPRLPRLRSWSQHRHH
jgi:hypothetical protein